jgi:hypothetical protein
MIRSMSASLPTSFTRRGRSRKRWQRGQTSKLVSSLAPRPGGRSLR